MRFPMNRTSAHAIRSKFILHHQRQQKDNWQCSHKKGSVSSCYCCFCHFIICFKIFSMSSGIPGLNSCKNFKSSKYFEIIKKLNLSENQRTKRKQRRVLWNVYNYKYVWVCALVFCYLVICNETAWLLACTVGRSYTYAFECSFSIWETKVNI